jgi:hypothetical protein
VHKADKPVHTLKELMSDILNDGLVDVELAEAAVSLLPLRPGGAAGVQLLQPVVDEITSDTELVNSFRTVETSPAELRRVQLSSEGAS